MTEGCNIQQCPGGYIYVSTGNLQTSCLRIQVFNHSIIKYKSMILQICCTPLLHINTVKLLTMYTTVRLTTAEVVQHPHVCRVHNLQYIFILMQSPFSSNLGKGDCRSIK